MSGAAVRAGQAFVEVGLRSKVAEGVRRVQAELAAASAGFRTLGTSIAATGAGMTTAFTGLLAAIAWPTRLASNMEQLSVEFEVMTGSAEVAQNMLKSIQQFAAETPFDLPGLAKAAKTLLAYGVTNERILPSLRALGDVSGGNQEKLDRLAIAFGQTQSKGKLMAQEVNQMVENGFNPLQEISRTTGKSMNQLFKEMEAGEISAAMVAQAFESLRAKAADSSA